MDTNKKTIIEALEQNMGIVSAACQAVDMPRSTFYNWLKDDPEFKAAVDEIQEFAIDHVESVLHGQINKGDTTACIFYLKTKGKKRGYIEKQEIEHSGQVAITWQETKTYETKSDPIETK